MERDPQACHRSLIAERLAAQYGLEELHLRPPGSARAELPAGPLSCIIDVGA